MADVPFADLLSPPQPGDDHCSRRIALKHGHGMATKRRQGINRLNVTVWRIRELFDFWIRIMANKHRSTREITRPRTPGSQSFQVSSYTDQMSTIDGLSG